MAEGCGEYYAWGELYPKNNYSWSTYKWCKGSKNTLTKYCYDWYSGYNQYEDNRFSLESEDDVASCHLGDFWRIPTRGEWYELFENCSYATTTINGIKGVKLTSTLSGYENQWIFLPAAGFFEGVELIDTFCCSYWSSNLYPRSSPAHPESADGLFYNCNSVYDSYNLTGYWRSSGMTVRPVYDD